MASIHDIVAADSYQGNANLGGGGWGVANLDTRPVEALAHYTFLYNKSEYDQRAIDTQNAIAKLSELDAYNPNDSLPKDKEQAMQAYNQLYEYANQYARTIPKNNAERVNNLLQFQKNVGMAKKLITSANGRSTAYQLRQKGILEDATLSSDEKQIKLKGLEDDVKNTDIWTQIPATPKFDQTVPTVGAAKMMNVEVGRIGGDDNVEGNYKFFDPKTNMNEANAETMGLKAAVLDPNSEEYKNLSPLQKQDQDLLRQGKGKSWTLWSQTSDVFNSALKNPKYQQKDANGNISIDYNAIQSDNPLIGSTLSLVDRYNTWASKMKADFASGKLTDKMGNVGNLMNPVDATTFFTIDKNKGLSADQMVFLQKFANASPDEKTIDIKHTGEAGQNSRAALAQSGENYRARLVQEGENKRAALKTPTTPATTDNQDYGNIIDAVDSTEVRTLKGEKYADSDHTPLHISGGRIVRPDGTKPKGAAGGVTTLVVPASAVGDEVLTEFNKDANNKGPDGSVVMSQIAPVDGKITIRVENDQITGVMTSQGTFADRNKFADITQKSAYKMKNKQRTATDLGKGNKPRDLGSTDQTKPETTSSGLPIFK